MDSELPGLDEWIMRSPREQFVCCICERPIDDEEAERWFDKYEITCDICLTEMADQDAYEYRGEL